MSKIPNEDRHMELSDKLFVMAEALMKEGDETDDYIIQSTGNFIMLLSGIMTSETDMKTVADLLAMFSAKKVLDGQMMSESGEGGLEEMFNKMRESLEDRYEDDDEDDDEEEE